MKKTSKAITRILTLAMFLFCLVLNAMAANTTTQVAKVSTAVALTTDVDYVITDATPFEGDGVVDIQNTEHAVLILQHVRPSQAKKLLASRVKINGANAVNGQNCQLKIYREGSIIMPYSSGIQPLTVYTEANRSGESKSFSVGERVGLSGAFNNNIESFVLKRGYMATFFMQSDGKGYSRIFIADKADRTVNLQAPLKNTISAVRVMQWTDATKKGMGGRDQTINNALGTTWCYNWDAGDDKYEDRQFVTQRHHESGTKNGNYEGAWPSVEACNAYGSEHILGHNEPENVSDPREVVSSVDMVLNIWPDLMATGKRLCSPAVSSNYNWLYEFLDSIDARGWRCDVVAVHSYWYNDWGSWNSTLSGIHNRSGRPLWITEMNYGANWTGWPGSDRSGSETNQNIQLQHMGPIIDGLESASYLERYAYYNAAEDCRSCYLNGKLTKIGEYIAAKESNIAYNSSKEYVPKIPNQYAPSKLTVNYDKKAFKAAISWYDANGEFNQSMVLQRSTDGGKTWVDYYTPKIADTGATYSYTDQESRDGYRYRVKVIDGKNVEQTSVAVVAALTDVTVGDAVTVGENTMYVGGNMLVNGNFDLGFTGWTNGKGNVLSSPHFYLANVGDERGNYLLSWVNQGVGTAGSVRTAIDVVPNGQYYFSAMFCNTGGKFQSIDVEDENNGSTIETPVFQTIECTDWTLQDGNFNVGEHNKMFMKLRWLPMARIDECFLARLFPTVEEAMADAAEQARMRARAYINYNNIEVFNTELQGVIDATYATNEEAVTTIETALKAAIKALTLMPQLNALAARAAGYVELGMPGSDVLVPLVSAANQLTSATQVPELVANLNREMATMSAWQTTNLIPNASFTSTLGWVNTSTYAGDQRRHTVLGRSCWNSWWSGTKDAVKNATMGIEQELTGLDEGLYYLSCDATTEHYCLSDQHAFIKSGDQKAVSPTLTYDRFDYPDLDNADRWETLSTTPLYLPEGGSITVGFESSKQGAVDGAWIAGPDKTNADNREGWWCATDFVLYRLPLHQRSSGGAHWGTVCLPYAVKPGPGVQLYEVAGVLTEDEQQYICLQPIAEQQAGVPFVYYSDRGTANFFESGDALTSPIDGSNGLRGIFNDYTISRRLVGAIVLVNGTFYQLGSDEVPYELSKYYAYINKLANVGTLESWSGMKLPLAPEGSLNTGVAQPKATPAAQTVSVYKLDGVRAKQPTTGINILQQGTDVKKILVK